MQRHKYIIFSVSLLLLVVVFLGVYDGSIVEKRHYSIAIGNNIENINVWENEGSNYLFLPNVAKVSKGAVSKKTSILRGSNIYTIFIDTQSGTLNKLHKNKAYTENVRLRVYTKDGKITYNDNTYRASINGRGNSTWNLEKKSYLITLPTPSAFLGMPSSNKWVLLANGYDETNMRNRLVYEYARTLGFPWTVESRYADVYINGDYSGLYLVTEKIRVDATHLPELYNNQGSFLCHLALNYQQESSRQKFWFFTDQDNCIQVDYPYYPNERQLREIQSAENNFGRLLADHRTNLSQILDMKTWTVRYLVDEIFENKDGDKVSSYHYYNSKDHKYYAGPLWDYDLTIGNQGEYCINPKSMLLLDSITTFSGHRAFDSLLFGHGRNRDTLRYYYGIMSETFCQKTDSIIDSYTRLTDKSAQMNYLRYRTMFDNIRGAWNLTYTIPAIKQHLHERKKFLDSFILGNTTYCRIRYFIDGRGVGQKIGHNVAKGSPLDFVPTKISTGRDSIVWVNEANGDTVYMGDTITRDMNLLSSEIYQQQNKNISLTGIGQIKSLIWNNKELLAYVIAPIGIILLLLGIMIKRNFND